MSGDFISKPVVGFDASGAPHVQVDEDQQMLQYLADIALEDLALLPDPSTRRARPGGLLDQYRQLAAAEHAAEAATGVIPDGLSTQAAGTEAIVPLVVEFEQNPVFNPTAGIPKASFGKNDAPSYDNATWFSTVQPPETPRE